VVAVLATTLWVAWLLALPDTARGGSPEGLAAVSTTVSVAAATTVPISAPPPVAGERETPPRSPGATADAVVALANVLALTEDEAARWAQENGYLLRVTWRDGQALAYSYDDVPERLNLELSAGVVVFAWFG